MIEDKLEQRREGWRRYKKMGKSDEESISFLTSKIKNRLFVPL